MEGWIFLHRKLLKWEWYKKSEMVHLFIHLLLNANHTNGKFEGIDIQRGQLITGLKSLNQNTKISIQTLRTCLTRLKSTGEITIKSTNKYSIITICNYDDYQILINNINNQSNIQTNKQLTNNQQITNKQLTTNNNDNNVNNVNKKRFNEIFEKFKNQTQWFESIERSTKIKVNTLKNELKEFYFELIAKDDIYRDERDYKKHFVAWVKLRNEIPEDKKQTTYPAKIKTDQTPLINNNINKL